MGHLPDVFVDLEAASEAVKTASAGFDRYNPSCLQQAIADLKRAATAQQEAMKIAAEVPTLLAEYALTCRKLSAATQLVSGPSTYESTRELKRYLAMVEKGRWLRQDSWISPCQRFNSDPKKKPLQVH